MAYDLNLQVVHDLGLSSWVQFVYDSGDPEDTDIIVASLLAFITSLPSFHRKKKQQLIKEYGRRLKTATKKLEKVLKLRQSKSRLDSHRQLKAKENTLRKSVDLSLPIEGVTS